MVRRNLHSICSMSIWLHHLDTGLCSSPSAACQVPSSVSISHIPQRILSVKINFWISHWYDAVTSRSSSTKNTCQFFNNSPGSFQNLSLGYFSNVLTTSQDTIISHTVLAVCQWSQVVWCTPSVSLLNHWGCLFAFASRLLQELTFRRRNQHRNHIPSESSIYFGLMFSIPTYTTSRFTIPTHIVPVNQRVVSHLATQPFRNPHKWQVRRNLEASSLERTKLE